ncbi:UNVERIFIED_CONTAM: hypothetical protein RMT77_011367 [Armadillidium vulgare]
MYRLLICVLLVILCLQNIRGFDIIELNHDVGPHSPLQNSSVDHPFTYKVQEAGYSRGFWLAFGEITMAQFLSTTLASPYTFYEFGRKLDQIPFRDLFATAAVIDVREKVAKNNMYEVSVEDVKNWIKKNGMFPPHCIVLFNTGWDEGRYPDRIAYYGLADGEPTFPGVSLEALNYILNHEKTHGIYFVGVGIDGPGINSANNPPNHVEQAVAKLNKYIVGDLKELKRLPPKGAKIMVMPMKIKDGIAAAARVAARIPLN